MNKLATNYIFMVIYQLLIMVTPFITIPYVSRILLPKGIGIDAYVNSIVQMFIVFSMVGIPLYGSRQIAKTETKEETSKEFLSIYLLQVIFTMINFIIYILFISTLDENKKYFIIYSLSILSCALDITWYFNGKEQIKFVAIRNIIVRIIGIALIFLLVKDSKDLFIYILINVLIQLFGQVIMWRPLIRQISFYNISFINLKTHFRPIISLFLPQIIVQVYVLVNKIILGNFSGETEVGFYNQSYKIISLCLGIISSLGTVFIPRISSEYSKGNLENVKKYVNKSLHFVFFITIPMIYGLIAISDNFVNLFFGNGFEKISTLIVIMSPVLLFIGMSTVFGYQILISTNQQIKYTFSVTIGATLSLFINILLVPSLGSIGSSISLLVAEGVGMVIQLFFTRRYFRSNYLIKQFAKYLTFGMIMFFLLLLITNTTEVEPFILLLVQILTGIFIYILMLSIFKDPILKKIINYIQSKLIKQKSNTIRD